MFEFITKFIVVTFYVSLRTSSYLIFLHIKEDI